MNIQTDSLKLTQAGAARKNSKEGRNTVRKSETQQERVKHSFTLNNWGPNSNISICNRPKPALYIEYLFSFKGIKAILFKNLSTSTFTDASIHQHITLLAD